MTAAEANQIMELIPGLIEAQGAIERLKAENAVLCEQNDRLWALVHGAVDGDLGLQSAARRASQPSGIKR